MNPQNQGQEQPRVPNVDPQLFATLNELDGFLGKAPLNRVEHQQVGNAFQFILRRLEADKLEIQRLTARVAELEAAAVQQKNAADATAMVTAALK